MSASIGAGINGLQLWDIQRLDGSVELPRDRDISLCRPVALVPQEGLQSVARQPLGI